MSPTTDETPDPDALLDAVGAAFSRIRRRTALVKVDPPATRKDATRNMVLNVIEDAEGEVTVGSLAEQLSMDPSAASRMVSDCIEHGYVVRAASQGDGRRTVLRTTPEGASLRRRFQHQNRQAFEQITHDWPESERLELARLIIKYADAAAQLR